MVFPSRTGAPLFATRAFTSASILHALLKKHTLLSWPQSAVLSSTELFGGSRSWEGHSPHCQVSASLQTDLRSQFRQATSPPTTERLDVLFHTVRRRLRSLSLRSGLTFTLPWAQGGLRLVNLEVMLACWTLSMESLLPHDFPRLSSAVCTTWFVQISSLEGCRIWEFRTGARQATSPAFNDSFPTVSSHPRPWTVSKCSESSCSTTLTSRKATSLSRPRVFGCSWFLQVSPALATLYSSTGCTWPPAGLRFSFAGLIRNYASLGSGPTTCRLVPGHSLRQPFDARSTRLKPAWRSGAVLLPFPASQCPTPWSSIGTPPNLGEPAINRRFGVSPGQYFLGVSTSSVLDTALWGFGKRLCTELGRASSPGGSRPTGDSHSDQTTADRPASPAMPAIYLGRRLEAAGLEPRKGEVGRGRAGNRGGAGNEDRRGSFGEGSGGRPPAESGTRTASTQEAPWMRSYSDSRQHWHARQLAAVEMGQQ